MTLLIIDDDAINNCTHSRIAETSGLFNEIHCFKNGKDALNFLDQANNGTINPPDLIVLNPDMPDMCGPDFIRLVRHSTFPFRKLMRFVILSGPGHSIEIEPVSSMAMEYNLLKAAGLRYVKAAIFSLHHLAMIMAPDPFDSVPTPHNPEAIGPVLRR